MGIALVRWAGLVGGSLNGVLGRFDSSPAVAVLDSHKEEEGKMNQPARMTASREAVLSKIGAGIEIDHARYKLILTGRSGPSGKGIGRRARLTRIRNVSAAIQLGFLVSPEVATPRRFAEITFMQGSSEQVITMEAERAGR
jgi:hypothetical protein